MRERTPLRVPDNAVCFSKCAAQWQEMRHACFSPQTHTHWKKIIYEHAWDFPGTLQIYIYTFFYCLTSIFLLGFPETGSSSICFLIIARLYRALYFHFSKDNCEWWQWSTRPGPPNLPTHAWIFAVFVCIVLAKYFATHFMRLLALSQSISLSPAPLAFAYRLAIIFGILHPPKGPK